MIIKTHESEGVKSSAVYSDCETYRYILRRTWDPEGKNVLFIGLNPSTATEKKNDPTITRIIGFAKRWGYGNVTICNVFAYRATLPKDLKKATDPIGIDNDEQLQKEIQKANLIIAAWGNHATHKNRGTKIRELLTKYSHFGLTKNGEPKHPLYQPNNATLYQEE